MLMMDERAVEWVTMNAECGVWGVDLHKSQTGVGARCRAL